MGYREGFISNMRDRQIMTPFHYIPLHDSPAGKRFGRFQGPEIFTTCESERLVRLPIWFNMTDDMVAHVIAAVTEVLSLSQ
ncbi:dTDP-4-amino-4,6-dideoxygalactose transaminase [compost metagenome]